MRDGQLSSIGRIPSSFPLFVRSVYMPPLFLVCVTGTSFHIQNYIRRLNRPNLLQQQQRSLALTSRPHILFLIYRSTMVFVALALSLLLATSTVLGSPIARLHDPFPPTPKTPKGLLCNLPIPMVQKLLCPRQIANSDPAVITPLGTAHGVDDTANAVRFAVRYGTAARWEPSSVVTSWQLPNGNTNASSLPLACPQDGIDEDAMSEDCLSLLLYVPTSISPGSDVPTMMWIHGGSFTQGSATFPGLDGSNFAAATGSIVAVIQYRLGALGLMAPNGNMNLAVQDVMTAMNFLQTVLPSFGGSPSKITIAGQSSGATMIRALLATPSASSLFQSAILQSDPMDYGFLSAATQQTLQTYFNGLLPCSTTDVSCLNNISIDDLLGFTDNLSNTALTLDQSVGLGEPLRVVRDGSLITTPLDDTAPFPAVSKPIMVSNVKNEAGLSIYSDNAFPDSVAPTLYDEVVEGTFGDPDTSFVLANPNYAIPPSAQNNANTDARPTLEKLGTDQIWRCPGWTFARNWIGGGGNAYVGLYVVGASYPGNDAVSFCTESGIVCHQDDIEIVFGTVPSPTSQQATLTAEMQARYKAFMNTGNPNVAGHANWQLATASDVHALTLGGSGEVAAGGCDPSFFGDVVQYDYQKFDI